MVRCRAAGSAAGFVAVMVTRVRRSDLRTARVVLARPARRLHRSIEMSDLTEIARQIPGYDPWRDADGWEFDADAARTGIDFFHEQLVIPDGPKAGQPLILSEYQQALTANIHGWHRTGNPSERRYREVFLYVARKNNKSCWSAGELVQAMTRGRVSGAQFYSIAADAKQAAIVFNDARQMILNSRWLRGKFKITDSYKSIERKADFCVYKALSSEDGTKHGLRPSFIIADELHAHPNSKLLDTMTTGTAIEGLDPLTIYTTTADFSRESMCNTKYKYACMVRDGQVNDPRFLPAVFECKKNIDWRNPDEWIAANPNMGLTVSRDYLQRACERAQNEPSFENEFKRLHLNIQTQSVEKWLDEDQWDACPSEEIYLDGEVCYGGLDMSSNNDITAFVLYFPERKACRCWFWLPGDNAEIRQRKRGVPYTEWVRDGYIMETPGNYIEPGVVVDEVERLAHRYDIRKVGADQWQAAWAIGELQKRTHDEWIEAMPQNKPSMTSPCKSLERLIGDGELNHGGNPVLRWMAMNCVVDRESSRDGLMPSKGHSSEKIDGISALVTAIGTCEADDNEYAWYRPGGLSL